MFSLSRIKNKKYLEWVRSLPCVITGDHIVEAHHLIGYGQSGMGLKASDWYAFPLSPLLHRELHDRGWKEWEEKYGCQWRFVAQTMHQAAEEGILLS